MALSEGPPPEKQQREQDTPRRGGKGDRGFLSTAEFASMGHLELPSSTVTRASCPLLRAAQGWTWEGGLLEPISPS